MFPVPPQPMPSGTTLYDVPCHSGSGLPLLPPRVASIKLPSLATRCVFTNSFILFPCLIRSTSTKPPSNMGILSRKAPPPTTVDLGDANHPSTQPSGDLEKSDKEVQLENNTTGARARNIDPELERRVVRKLDWHVPPLAAFLCEPRYY